MLLCASCNRAKSWSCEHCINWQQKDVAVCGYCYWANPNHYQHIATIDERRLTLIWSGANEVAFYEQINLQAAALGLSLADYLKQLAPSTLLPTT
jgi:hypothetical protein